MKKSLVLASLLAAFGAAHAQSSVTLYGVLDASIGETNTVTTPAGGVSSSVSSRGYANEGALSGSRFGIRGTEALGNGLNAIFVTEHGYSVTNGSLTGVTAGSGAQQLAGTGRRTIVGLNGKFGEVAFGREYTPFWKVLGSSLIDYDGIATYSVAGQTASATAVRASGSINYATPVFSGFQAMLQHSNNTTTAAGVTTFPAKQTGFGAQYKNGAWAVGAAYNEVKTGASNAPYGKVTNTGIAGSYTMQSAGVTRLIVALSHLENKASNSAPGSPVATVKETNVNVTVPFGAAYVIAGYGRNRLSNTGTGVSGRGNDYMVGAGYILSPRTDVYARYAVTGNVTSYTAAGVAMGNVKTKNWGVGLRHKF